MTNLRPADIGSVVQLLVSLGVSSYFDVFENRGMFGDDVFDASLVLVRRDVPWVRAPLNDLWAIPAIIEESFKQHPKQPH